jgi:hypothetical protein
MRVDYAVEEFSVPIKNLASMWRWMQQHLSARKRAWDIEIQHLSDLLACWGNRKNVLNVLLILALLLQAQLMPLFGLENVSN